MAAATQQNTATATETANTSRLTWFQQQSVAVSANN